MSLIIVLLALLAERMAVFIHPWREHHWFEYFSQNIAKRISSNPYFAFSFSLFPIIFCVFIVHLLLMRFSFGWASWIFDLLVLIYCLGNTHLRLQVRECYDYVEKNDQEKAQALLWQYFDVLEKERVTPYLLMKACYRASLQRIFSILFWFILLGPMGAILYRFTQKLSVYGLDRPTDKLRKLAEKLTFILDWVPARLLALSFCLAGHFTSIFNEWRISFKSGISDTYQVLYTCGHIAVSARDSVDTDFVLAQFDEAYYLICRSLFIWLVVLALVILF